MTPAAHVGPRCSTCPGCGWTAPHRTEHEPEEHAATAACREAYHQLLARSSGDPEYRRVHQVVVDAYACQHPSGQGRREIQKIALCLMTLGVVYEEGGDPHDGPVLHQRMVAHRPPFVWLVPPSTHRPLAAAAVLEARSASEHEALVRDWGREVWEAWEPHHPTVRAWNRCVRGES